MKLEIELDTVGRPIEVMALLDPVDNNGYADIPLAKNLQSGDIRMPGVYAGDESSGGRPYMRFYMAGGFSYPLEGVVDNVVKAQKALSDVLSEAHRIEHFLQLIAQAKTERKEKE